MTITLKGLNKQSMEYVSLKKYITMLDMMQNENITAVKREMTIGSTNKHSVGKRTHEIDAAHWPLVSSKIASGSYYKYAVNDR